MKKKYLKPETLTVKIAHSVMLDTSDTNADKEKEVLSRRGRFSGWDEEYDSEE